MKEALKEEMKRKQISAQSPITTQAQLQPANQAT